MAAHVRRLQRATRGVGEEKRGVENILFTSAGVERTLPLVFLSVPFQFKLDLHVIKVIRGGKRGKKRRLWHVDFTIEMYNN